MSITIPGFVTIAVLISVVWFGVVVLCARPLFVQRLERWHMRRHKTGSVVPRWPAYTAMTIAGPIGWGLMVMDQYDSYKSRKATERWRAREEKS